MAFEFAYKRQEVWRLKKGLDRAKLLNTVHFALNFHLRVTFVDPAPVLAAFANMMCL